MKIKHYHSDQFAGMNQTDISFEAGMNVILGDNETGKSTLISGISSALLRSEKVGGKTNEDTEFREKFKPSRPNGSSAIDATVRFEEGDKEYTIEKCWLDCPSVKLTEGNSEEIYKETAGDKMKELLRHDASFYENLVFGRQNHSIQSAQNKQKSKETVLEWCNHFFDKKTQEMNIQELQKTVQSTSMDSPVSAMGGFSEDKFIALLDKKIESMERHWNFERDCPMPNAQNKSYKNALGDIEIAYNDYDKNKKERERVQKNQEDLEKSELAVKEVEENLKRATERQKELEQTKTKIENIATLRNVRDIAKEKWEKADQDLKEWQDCDRQYNEAVNLQKKKNKRDWDERIMRIKENNKIIEEYKSMYNQNPNIQEDVKELGSISEDIEKCKNRLLAQQMKVSFELEEGYQAIIHRPDDSTQSYIGNAELDDVRGYLELEIPGIATIKVAPKEIDVDALKSQIRTKEEQKDKILECYHVKSKDELEKKLEQIETKRKESDKANFEIEHALETCKTIEELEDQARSLFAEDISIPENLEKQIENLTQGVSLDKFITTKETLCNEHKKNCSSQDELKNLIPKYEREYQDAEDKYNNACEITEISPEEFGKSFNEIKERVEEYENKRKDLYLKIGSLENETEDLSELEDAEEQAKEKWNRLKEQCGLYQQIKNDFEKLRENTEDSFSKFRDKFNEYLSNIAGEGLLSNKDKDSFGIQSGRNDVTDLRLLSEGTKKTVLLAFRLAMLDYYYPNGGGLIVLDDELLDMDPTRREKSAELLKQYAKHNQVIFTTCDPAIAELLGGNRIVSENGQWKSADA